MHVRKLVILVPLLASLALAADPPKTPEAEVLYTLKHTVKVGDSSQYKMVVRASVGGIDGTLSGTAVDEVKKADESGYTVAEKWKDSKIEFNGQESEGPAIEFALSFSPKNELKDITGGAQTTDQYRSWFFLYEALHALRLPDKAIKVGDEWASKIAPSAANNNIALDLNYKLDGVVDADSKTEPAGMLRIKLSAKQTSGGDSTSEMTIWVDKTDSSVVKIDGTILKLTFPELPVPVDAKYTLERVAK